MLEQEQLFEKYNLDKKYYDEAKKHWAELEMIHNDYEKLRENLDVEASHIAAKLRKSSNKVHSVKFRIKNSDHLIAKIIKKEYLNIVNRDNYRQKITDLIGLRALHLFKSDWIDIHQFIKNQWHLSEKKPTANIRKGDSDEMFKEKGCKITVHPFGYRSVHYLIKTEFEKEKQIAEIQVRTIFEEGWSEIDHQIRYPHNLDNNVINEFLTIFNRLAGGADEMGSFIKRLYLHFNSEKEELKNQKETREITIQEKNRIISELKEKIDQMSSIEKNEKNDFKASLENLDKISSEQISNKEKLEKFNLENMLSPPSFNLRRKIILNNPGGKKLR